ncbi:1903_t:CDS:2 [Gigaspora margarita]|uniref:1903_t:CDS:1 n=1 Tax=Gigaspora margarita TaxID=4874 RepID=A0ABN7UGN1_GIGMA|nr:1903_t:CDS:2 [Gigaspora margarita]
MNKYLLTNWNNVIENTSGNTKFTFNIASSRCGTQLYPEKLFLIFVRSYIPNFK